MKFLKRFNTNWLLKTFFAGELRYASHLAWCAMLTFIFSDILLAIYPGFQEWAVFIAAVIVIVGSTFKEYVVDTIPEPKVIPYNVVGVFVASISVVSRISAMQ